VLALVFIEIVLVFFLVPLGTAPNPLLEGANTPYLIKYLVAVSFLEGGRSNVFRGLKKRRESDIYGE